MIYTDLEVYSDVSITEVPFDVYCNHPSTKVIVAALAFDIGDVMTFTGADIAGYTEIMRAHRGDYCAWNIGYERDVLTGQGLFIPTPRWHDTMVHARYVGLPGGLKACCKVPLLEVPASVATKSEKLLINKFCMPYTKKPGTPEEFAAFVEYCKQDVEALRYIDQKLRKEYPMPDSVRQEWLLDQTINKTGLPIDITSATFAQSETERLTAESFKEMQNLTRLDNPNSVQQLLPWLQMKGYPYDSLGKEFVQAALDSKRVTDEDCRKVLALRLSAAKSSVKKFAAIVGSTSADSRLRNTYVFYGAHTGRWSARGVQTHNLNRSEADEATVTNLEKREPVEGLDKLATCVRPMICAGPGRVLVVADLASIENRVLAWLSGCEAMLDIYREGRDPYKDFAVQLFNVDYDQVTKGMRQICKPPVLGCGFGLGAGQERQLMNGQIELTGLRKYAQNMGVAMTKAEAVRAVQTFRSLYKEVPEFWRYMEEAFYAAYKTRKRQLVGSLVFGATADAVYIELPSGRRIHYLNPKAWKGSKGLEIRFDGLRQNQWWSVSAWGGVFTENVVQAVARDVLVEGMKRAASHGMIVVGHCHDEIICESSVYEECLPGELDKLIQYMSQPIDWAPDLPLAAEGWFGKRYRK